MLHHAVLCAGKDELEVLRMLLDREHRLGHALEIRFYCSKSKIQTYISDIADCKGRTARNLAVILKNQRALELIDAFLLVRSIHTFLTAVGGNLKEPNLDQMKQSYSEVIGCAPKDLHTTDCSKQFDI